MTPTPLTPPLIEDGKRWFIRRFIHKVGELNFCLRVHQLEEWTKADRINFKRDRMRYSHCDFDFTAIDEYLVLKPLNEDASWVEGVLWYDGQDWIYQTGKPRITLDWGEKGALMAVSN